jgi:hypothetical protein
MPGPGLTALFPSGNGQRGVLKVNNMLLCMQHKWFIKNGIENWHLLGVKRGKPCYYA